MYNRNAIQSHPEVSTGLGCLFYNRSKPTPGLSDLLTLICLVWSTLSATYHCNDLAKLLDIKERSLYFGKNKYYYFSK